MLSTEERAHDVARITQLAQVAAREPSDGKPRQQLISKFFVKRARQPSPDPLADDERPCYRTFDPNFQYSSRWWEDPPPPVALVDEDLDFGFQGPSLVEMLRTAARPV